MASARSAKSGKIWMGIDYSAGGAASTVGASAAKALEHWLREMVQKAAHANSKILARGKRS